MPADTGRLTSRAADEAVARALEALVEREILPRGHVDPAGFHGFRERVRATFEVPRTSITPVMARLLFGIAALWRPRLTVGIGTYYGLALAWLAGPGLHGLHPPGEVVGADVDAAAVAGARANYARLGARDVRLLARDGRQVLAAEGAPIDLLYLDVDEPDRGKAMYVELLDLAYPRLAPDALVLAHDVSVPRFEADMTAYLARVRDASRFRATARLAIDPCGLAVTRR